MKKSTLAKIIAGIFALITLSTMLSSWYTIDQGERGVVLRAGEYVKNQRAGAALENTFS